MQGARPFRIRAGATSPAIRSSLLGADGLPFDLSIYQSIALVLRPQDRSRPAINYNVTLVSANPGVLSCDWNNGDDAGLNTAPVIPGRYDAHWWVQTSSDPHGYVTFPSAGYFVIDVGQPLT